MELPLTPLTAIAVHVCKYMEGQSRPVLLKDGLHVSPAMWELLRHADEDELEFLLKNLYPLDLTKFDPRGDVEKPDMPLSAMPVDDRMEEQARLLRQMYR